MFRKFEKKTILNIQKKKNLFPDASTGIGALAHSTSSCSSFSDEVKLGVEHSSSESESSSSTSDALKIENNKKYF